VARSLNTGRPAQKASLPMKIFLTGATGYTGGVVLKHLLGAGHAVAAIARTPPPGPPPKGLQWVTGDFADGNAIKACAASCDAAVHIGASHDKEMERLDGIVIRAIADAFAGSSRVFVSTSATPVYGDTGMVARDEHEPIENPHPLRAWRMRHDLEVAALGRRGIRGVVVRAGYIYGQAGGLLADIIRVARASGKAQYIGDGRNLTRTVHVDALAALYLLVLSNQSAQGVYNAVSDEVVRPADIATVVASSFGLGITSESLRVEEARKTLGEYADLAIINCVASALRARRELGWIPSAPSLLSELVGGSYQTQPLARYHSA